MDGPTALLYAGGSTQSAFIVESCFGYKLCISTLVLQSCSKVTNHAASETLWSELCIVTCWDSEVTQTGSPRWLMIQISYKTTLWKLSQTHIHRQTHTLSDAPHVYMSAYDCNLQCSSVVALLAKILKWFRLTHPGDCWLRLHATPYYISEVRHTCTTTPWGATFVDLYA